MQIICNPCFSRVSHKASYFTSISTPSFSRVSSMPHVQGDNTEQMLSLEETMASLECTAELPPVDSLVPILHHCRKKKNLQFAMRVHAYIRDRTAKTHRSLGNHLIPMLVDCGSLVIAQQVFDKFAHPNEHSWTSLIQGYVDCGEYDHAFRLFSKMKQESVNPSMFTLQALLKASARLKCITRGRKLHLEIVQAGYENDPYVSITLVDMYAKCDSLVEAQEVFDEMHIRDVVSWNALISGYVEHGHCNEALGCYRKMQLDAVAPDACTFICSLKACCSIRAIERGRKIHTEIVKEGLEEDPFLLSAMVDMYAKCGSLPEAQKVFDEVPSRDVVSWNALITGYAEHGFGEDVLICLEQMLLQGVSLSPVTYVCCLRACSSLGAISRGQELHAELVKEGFQGELHVGSALVDMYAKCGLLGEAREAFEELLVRDVVSWTALIAGYADYGYDEEALDCLKQMQLEGVFPDAVAYFCSLKACGSVGSLGRAREIHTSIAKDGFDSDLFVSSTLVDMYAKCGLLTEASDMFDELPVQDVVAWNALIAGYSFQGESEQVFHLLERMIDRGTWPDEITLLNVLTVCSHAGLIDKGLQHFKAMSKEYGIVNSIEHHTSLVDLLGRAGQLDEAVTMLEMRFQPNLVTWTTVLGACRKSGDVELARQVFERAMSVDWTEPALFILMSNVYANVAEEERAWQLVAD